MKLVHALVGAMLATPAAAAPDAASLAKLFGAREAVQGMRLSPNGENILFIKPLPGGHGAVTVVNIATSKDTNLARDGDNNSHLRWCGWKTDTRVICQQYGVVQTEYGLFPFTRLAAMDTNGERAKEIGYRPPADATGYVASTGRILDWLPDDPDNVLMQIYELPAAVIGNVTTKRVAGLSVQRVNVFTSARRMVEAPRESNGFDADAQGRVRLMARAITVADGVMTNKLRYLYRPKTGGLWQPLIGADLSAAATNESLGFDESGDWLYMLMPKDGRQALYRVAADGSGKQELVFAHPAVDVTGLLRIGKYNRPVAAEYYTTEANLHFLDPALEKLDASLSKALPNHPKVYAVDESWDGSRKLLFASSDVDPGRYYLYDGKTRRLGELLTIRPELAGLTLAKVKSISYPARDGTQIPAYLTLPPGRDPKNLPMIVMPHGGPASRDTWGFDWLPQYFAQLGYAVLQPNFRGSAGYGEAWFQQNGFKSWQTAISDINDGAHWLAKEGIGDPKKAAIVGWSYGGYAALQANVAEPKLYKAVVAVAPVTDLQQLKTDSKDFSNKQLVKDFIGDGPHIIAGSPAKNAGRIEAPVLMFHGSRDRNVALVHSKMMDAALAKAGKQHQLVVYPDLDHQLDHEGARADLLLKSADFLATNMK